MLAQSLDQVTPIVTHLKEESKQMSQNSAIADLDIQIRKDDKRSSIGASEESDTEIVKKDVKNIKLHRKELE